MKKLAIVTGGTRGIGKSIVYHLLRDNYRVFFTYCKSEELAETITNEFPESSVGFKVNSNSWEEIKSFAGTVLKANVPDVLINNVGINDDNLFLEQEIEAFWNVVKLNLGSTLCFCKSFLNSMMERKNGHIINISSIASVKPKLGNGAYGTSKAAIERFSKTLALEVARFNVSVNCVSPGFVETDIFKSFLSGRDKKQFYSQIPMRKIYHPDDISRLVLSICNGTIKTTGTVFYIGNGENVGV